MNLTNVKEDLLKLGAQVGLTVEEETQDKLVVHTELTAQKYFRNTVYCRIVIFASGTLHMFLTFDELEQTYDNFFLINKFNLENPWFRAYIGNVNDKDYLELHYTAFNLENKDQITDTVGFLFSELLAEKTLTYLKPILANSKF